MNQRKHLKFATVCVCFLPIHSGHQVALGKCRINYQEYMTRILSSRYYSNNVWKWINREKYCTYSIQSHSWSNKLRAAIATNTSSTLELPQITSSGFALRALAASTPEQRLDSGQVIQKYYARPEILIKIKTT